EHHGEEAGPGGQLPERTFRWQDRLAAETEDPRPLSRRGGVIRGAAGPGSRRRVVDRGRSGSRGGHGLALGCGGGGGGADLGRRVPAATGAERPAGEADREQRDGHEQDADRSHGNYLLQITG